MKHRNILIAAVTALVLAQTPIGFSATPTNTQQAITMVAEQLFQSQIIVGLDAGSWRNEQGYTGSIVAGLVDAYQLTGNNDYKDAAELGGNWILENSLTCDFYGDEAYALTKLSHISCDPNNNPWRSALEEFFTCVHNQPAYPPYNVKGTDGYIQAFADGTDVTTAVFYLSHFTVAAYDVNAIDKSVWRTYLIGYLAYVQDDPNGELLPVLALGVATWALAETGPLDNTPIFPYPSGSPAPPWTGKKLNDLPAFLQSQRADINVYPSGGNFYWRFDHNYGLGYTEDDIFGIMGLVSGQKSLSTTIYNYDIDLVRSKLLNAVDPNTGEVWAHVDWDLISCYTYAHMAGEFLTVISKASIPGDINLDDKVDLVDLSLFCDQWSWQSSPSCVNTRNEADLNKDGTVNFNDFAVFALNWKNHL